LQSAKQRQPKKGQWCLREASHRIAFTMVPSISIFFLSFSSLFLLHNSLPIPPQSIDHFTSQINQINLKIAHLESVLEETNRKVAERDLYIQESENRMNEMAEKIHHLNYTLSSLKGDSLHAETRLKALEEEVWTCIGTTSLVCLEKEQL
ncbi:hypothetical protein KIW84_015403, partial [Lathyrus oleraceus]